MNNSLKWEGGSFTLSTIKETSQEEWVNLMLKTQTERAIYFGFTKENFEDKLNKIWNDVNGIRETPKIIEQSTKADTKDNRKVSNKK